jgi:uncharacterized protein (TIRG00374 family)
MKYIKPLIIITVLVFAALFLNGTDFNKVAASLNRVGYSFLWLLLISFSSYFLGTIAWRYCMGEMGKQVGLLRLFVIRHVGETVGIVNPTSIVAGEAVKVYLLRHHDIRQKTVVTSVLLSRVLMMLTQLMVFTVVALYVAIQSGRFIADFDGISNILCVLITVVMLIRAIVLSKGKLKNAIAKTKAGRYIACRTVKLRGKIREAMFELKLFFKTNKMALGMSVMFFLLHWITGSLEFFVVLRLLGVAVSYAPVVFVDMSVILFKSAGAFIPAQIGVEEYGNKVMLASIGIAAMEIWVTASILRRARQLFWIVFGLGAYFFIDRKKGSLVHQADGDTVCKP